MTQSQAILKSKSTGNFHWKSGGFSKSTPSPVNGEMVPVKRVQKTWFARPNTELDDQNKLPKINKDINPRTGLRKASDPFVGVSNTKPSSAKPLKGWENTSVGLGGLGLVSLPGESGESGESGGGNGGGGWGLEKEDMKGFKFDINDLISDQTYVSYAGGLPGRGLSLNK